MLSNLSETTVSLIEDVLSTERPYEVMPQLIEKHRSTLSEIHTAIEIFKYVAHEHEIDDTLFRTLQFSFLLSIDHLQTNLSREFQDQRNLMLTNALYKAISQLIEQPAEPSSNVLFLLLNLSAFNITLPTSLLTALHERCSYSTEGPEQVHVLKQEDLGFMLERLANDPDITTSFLIYQALVEPLMFFEEQVVEVFVEQLFMHSNPKLHDCALYFVLNENMHIALAAFTVLRQEHVLKHATIQDLARLQVIRQWLKDSKLVHADYIINQIQRNQPSGSVQRGGYKLIEAKATLADYSESYLVKLSLEATPPSTDTDTPPKTLHAYCHFALRSGIENIQLLQNETERFTYEQMMQESELEFKAISEAQLQQMIQHTLSQQSLQNPPAELLHLWQCYESECFYPQPIDTQLLFDQPCDNPALFSRDELIEQWILLDMDYHSEFTPENSELLEQHLIHALIIYQGQFEMMRELQEVADVFAVEGDFYATSLGNACHNSMMETASELNALSEDFALYDSPPDISTNTTTSDDINPARPKNYWLIISHSQSKLSPVITLKINDSINLSRMHTILALLFNCTIDTDCAFGTEQMIFTDQPNRFVTRPEIVANINDSQISELFTDGINTCTYTNNLRSPEVFKLSIVKSEPLRDLNLFPKVENCVTQFGNEDNQKRHELQQTLDALFRGQLH